MDSNPELVRCWREAFQELPTVDIRRANILTVAHDTLVSPANSYGYMDGGIDRQYAEFFGPTLQRRVTDAISRRPEGYLPVGASILVPTGHETVPYLIVAPTMLLPEPVPASHAFRALVAVLRIAKQNAGRIRDIYCPGLATGIGQVPFMEAAEEMAAGFRAWVEREGPLEED